MVPCVREKIEEKQNEEKEKLPIEFILERQQSH